MDFEELSNLADWRNVEAWTLKEASMLPAAIDLFAHLGVRLNELGNNVPFTRSYKKALQGPFLLSVRSSLQERFYSRNLRVSGLQRI